MTGAEYDEDEPEEFRPAPHPDDRLWRHPSEVAAMQAALANAETAKLPVVDVGGARGDAPTHRGRLQVGLMVAAGVVVVGAAALTIGFVSVNGSDDAPGGGQLAAATLPIANPAPDDSGNERAGGTNLGDRIGVESSTESSADAMVELAARVHDEVAESLPRIQAVTSAGMREGSGLFITDDGHIATSAGLIADAEYVLAWTEDGQRWKAEVVASDPISDVAVVHIDSTDWPAVSFGSATPWDGQEAHALDHDDRTITLGEVTRVSAPLVEIDQPAALPGSAVVDDEGEVIAMVTADGTNRHATPAWMLEQVAVDLIASGTTVHVSLGVEVDDAESGDMVVVLAVHAETPAEAAGLRPGDLIDSFNGRSVADSASLYRLIQAADPGDEAVLTVTRNNSRRIVVTSLIEHPG